jgi:hypothetical protein
VAGGASPEGNGGHSGDRLDESAGGPPTKSQNLEPSGATPPATPSATEVPEAEAPDPEARTTTAIAAVDIERVIEVWPAVVDHLRDSGSAMLSTLFDEAKPIGIDEERSVLHIGFPDSAKFQKKKAESSANVERMTDAIASIAGQRLRPVYELMEDSGDGNPEKPAEMSEDELVEMVKESFDADEVAPDAAQERGTG